MQDGAPEELATAEIAAAAGADIPSDRRELNSWYAVPAVSPFSVQVAVLPDPAEACSPEPPEPPKKGGKPTLTRIK